MSTFYTGRNRLRGFGWGSQLSSWLRTNIVPMLKTGAKYLGKHLIAGTSHAATDILEGVKPKDAFKHHIKQVGRDIFNETKQKLAGRGIMKARRRKRKKRVKRCKGKGKGKNKANKKKRSKRKRKVVERPLF